MRRPTLCGEVHTVDDSYDGAPGPGPAAVGASLGRLSRVKRMLTDSLLLGRRGPGPASNPHQDAHSPCFGVPLRDLQLTKEGVPVVVTKICGYLENHGLQCASLFQQAGNTRLAERLRCTLDLERANDVLTAALLLKLWLKELPEPLIPGHAVTELLTVHRKVRDEPLETWRQAVRVVLCALPELNLRLLRHLLRFLDRYCHHQLALARSQRPLPQLAAVFAPLLVLKGLELEYLSPEQASAGDELTARLIQNHAAIFHQWLLDHPNVSKQTTNSVETVKKCFEGNSRKAVPVPDSQNHHPQRKRKERNESANSNQSLERKVIRSSSEERHVEVSVGDCKNESIRRVSSHEDFRLTKQQVKRSNHVNKFTTVVELADQPRDLVISNLPLQECNHIEPNQQSRDFQPQHVQHAFQDTSLKEKENDMNQGLKEREDVYEDEHEKRRSSERVSRALAPPRSSVGRRTPTRRKRPQGADAASELSDESKSSLQGRDDANKPLTSHVARPSTLVHHASERPRTLPESPGKFVDEDDPDEDLESLSDESRPESSHSFLQLHPPERDRSPSPSISPCSCTGTPPLDLSTLHQSVDSSEPVASRGTWSWGWDRDRDPQQQGDGDGGRGGGGGVLLSPRNSTILTRRVYMDYSVPPSPPGDHGSCLPGPAVDADDVAKKLNKQISSVKKKLKRYEEGFETEFGYRPSHSDKLANKDIKRLYAELSYLRKELKQVKDNPMPVVSSQTEPSAARLGLSMSMSSSAAPHVSSSVSIVDTIADVERRLREKRRVASRPESLDEMSAEQHAAEKLALQKSLLFLEKLCGRASSKEDREIVRPLYDRYRQLKRIVARAASSKLKDSINELATIHEHEAMEFTTSTSTSILAVSDGGVDSQPVSSSASMNAGSSVQLQAQPSVEEASDSQTSSSDSLGENLHSLPLSDLVLQLTQTREEKKRLRRLLREQEEQFQLQTGRRMQREDRVALGGDGQSGEVYSAYKQTKAKLRLLEALVAKLR